MKIRVMHRTFKKSLKSGIVKEYERIMPVVHMSKKEYEELFKLVGDYFDKNGRLDLELESASGDRVIFRCIKPKNNH